MLEKTVCSSNMLLDQKEKKKNQDGNEGSFHIHVSFYRPFIYVFIFFQWAERSKVVKKRITTSRHPQGLFSSLEICLFVV